MLLRSGRITNQPKNIQNKQTNYDTNVKPNSIIDYKQNPTILANNKLISDLDTIFNFNYYNNTGLARYGYYSNKTLIIGVIKTLLDISDKATNITNKLPIILTTMSVINSDLGRELVRMNYKFSLVVKNKLVEIMMNPKIDKINKNVFLNIYNQLVAAGCFRSATKMSKLPKV